MCECDDGWYDPGNLEEGRDWLDCQRCVAGASCNGTGTTLGNMVIHRGYYRLHNDTDDVRKCPDYNPHSIDFLSRPSGCRGGVGAGDDLCRDRLGGVYCRGCAPSHSTGGYYSHSAEK